MPSPTLASTVASPAPPTNLSIFALTVTLAIVFNWIPSFATAATVGVSITFGITDILTASSTSLPARSIAAALSNGKCMFALSAEINAATTFLTLPPAR